MFQLNFIRRVIQGFSFVKLSSESKIFSQSRRSNLLGAAVDSAKNDKFQSKRSFDVEKALMNYSESDSIPWKQIRDSLFKGGLGGADVNSVILNSCINIKSVGACVSYYKFLSGSNVKLKSIECYLILSLFSSRSDKILMYEDILREIFEIIKPDLQHHKILFTLSAKVYFYIEQCWKEMTEIYNENLKFNLALSYLASAAFHHNHPGEGWNLISKNPDCFSKEFVDSYMNYCIRMAQENKFTPSLITDLVQFCQEHVHVIPSLDTLDKLKLLTNVLNNKNNGLLWSVHSCMIYENSTCSHCRSKIECTKISEEELKVLKSHFVNDVIINKNIHIKTSKPELNNFFRFLEGCSPYNFVIDGLNLYYGGKDKLWMLKMIDALQKRKMKILVIAKKHLLLKEHYKSLKNQCQVFITTNLTDDDVFIIYAALHGGIGTYFLTNDFFRDHANLIENSDLQKLFRKWQITHQCGINYKDFKLIYPKVHAGLPHEAKHSTPKGEEFSWHLWTKENTVPRPNSIDNINWICLKAKPN